MTVSIAGGSGTIGTALRCASTVRRPGVVFRLAEPYLARMLTMQLPVSNASARRDLAWAPRFPSYREGLREMFPHVDAALGNVHLRSGGFA